MVGKPNFGDVEVLEIWFGADFDANELVFSASHSGQSWCCFFIFFFIKKKAYLARKLMLQNVLVYFLATYE